MAGGKGRKVDPEINAINSILGALAELDGESIQRVLDYVMRRLSLPPSHSVATLPLPKSAELPAGDLPPSGRQLSIRDLKEQKKPESANQMAALVALHVNLDKTVELRKETSTAQAASLNRCWLVSLRCARAAAIRRARSSRTSSGLPRCHVAGVM